MKVGYMYNSNGSPIMEKIYCGFGDYYWGQAECEIEDTRCIGDTVEIHMGFGVFRTFTVAAVDDRNLLLQGV